MSEGTGKATTVPFNPSLNGPGLRAALTAKKSERGNVRGCTPLCVRVSGLSRCWCGCAACEAKTVINGKICAWNVCPHDPDGRLNAHVRAVA